jgi:transposase InsO family protein
MLALLVPLLRRDGELDLTEDEVDLLCAMSAATIDRRLRGAKVLAELRGRSHTKPGTLLKSQIPIRTWSEWDEGVPGFVEIDLVGHEGGNSFGEFCFTLTMTDIATGWTVNRSVPNKAAINVAEAIDHAALRFPFPIRGIDSDNGGEFINLHLFDYCTDHKITFTRSRPGNKNDGAHVEQKNWTHVRELVGYLRFDTPAELEVLNRIWALDQVFTNLLLTQQKLLSRERIGAKVIKRHDPAATPFDRAVRSGVLTPGRRGALTRARNALRPGEAKREIDQLCIRLERLALSKAPAPQRAVNRAFNTTPLPEVLREATNQRSRRN